MVQIQAATGRSSTESLNYPIPESLKPADSPHMQAHRAAAHCKRLAMAVPLPHLGETKMFIRNTWYVAGWDKEVGPSELFARTIIGIPVLMYRDAQGKVVALEDRCCHRGAPLSIGRREGDCVRCLYHGLKFDTGGRCVEAPAQQRIPPQAVRTFPVVERHRWLWIWMGDAEAADPSLIPDTHWLDDPAWRSLDGYIHYDVNYLLIADNLLDFSHLPFVHPTTLGGSEDYASVQPQVERLEDGVRITRWTLGTEAPPLPGR